MVGVRSVVAVCEGTGGAPVKGSGLSRETRGESRWVHLHTTERLSDRQASARIAGEARRWAAEEGMRAGGRVSSGGEFSPDGDRYSTCYVFEPLDGAVGRAGADG